MPVELMQEVARWRGRRIGLYGGSFNPAHGGHLHVARAALARLGADDIWLMVSPGNPFKDADSDMAPFAARLNSAEEIADAHPRLHASSIEARMGSRYTAQTAAILTQAMPTTRFFWMMGADNLPHFHRWYHIETLIKLMPIAIFDRPDYTGFGLASRFALRYQRFRVDAAALLKRQAPAWAFVTLPRHGASATDIRRQYGPAWALDEGFLGATATHDMLLSSGTHLRE